MTTDRWRRLGWRPVPDDPTEPLEPAVRVARPEDAPVTVKVSLPASFRRASSPPLAPSEPARTVSRDEAPAWLSRLRDAGIDARWERRGLSVPDGQREQAVRVLRQIDAEQKGRS